MGNIESLVVGIVSGILTSALIYLFVLIFTRIVLPWYRQLLYRGIEIQGEWTSSTDLGSGLIEEGSIELRQKADSVSGDLSLTKCQDGKIIKTETMRLTGRLKDRFLFASISPVKKSRLGIGTTLLEIVGDGSEMRGCESWYDIGTKSIMSGNIEWKRV
jgi:hypothetical protein